MRNSIRQLAKFVAVVSVAIAVAMPTMVEARGGGRSSSGHSHASSHGTRSGGHHATSTRSHGTRSATHFRKATGSTTASSHRSTGHRANRAVGVERDAQGKIKRTSAARTAFKKQNPCPATGKKSGACPGYVIDHRVALKRGGRDAPSNMQWQTRQAAREKDRTE